MEMIALDTNVLVRFAVKDTIYMAEAAKKLILHSECYVPITVSLELAWVLGSKYKLSRFQIISVYNYLLSLKNVHFENQNNLILALNSFEKGLDFADALHLAQSQNTTSFASFDKDFMRLATQHALKPQVRLP